MKRFTLGLLVMMSYGIMAQQATFINYGANVQISSGTTLGTGMLINDSGALTNQGTLATDFDLKSDATLQGNGVFRVGRDFWSTGLFLAGTSVIEMTGNAGGPAQLYCSDPIYRLRLTKTTGAQTVSAQSFIAVSNSLQLAAANNKIEVIQEDFDIRTATVTGTNGSKYFVTSGVGRLIRTVGPGQTQDFPVGFDESTYNLMKVRNNGAIAQDFAVRCLENPFSGGVSGSPVTTDAVDASWQVNKLTPGALNMQLTAQWRSSDALPGFNRNWCALTRHTGSGWDLTTGLLGPSGGSVSAPTRSRNGLTTDGVFAVFDETPAPCGAPYDFTVSEQSETSVAISWQPLSGVGSYQVRYRLNGTTAWSAVTTVTQPFVIYSSLLPDTDYEFQVRSLCGGSYSSFSPAQLFATKITATTCQIPVHSTVVAGVNNAQVFWNAVPGATGYTLRWRLQGATTWGSTATTTPANFNITGLLANTNYQYQVRANCPAATAFLSPVSFKTLPLPAFVAQQNQTDWQLHESVSLVVFPNPTDGKIFVAGDALDNIGQLVVTTIDGRALYTITPHQASTGIDVSDMPAGIYLLKAQYAHGRSETVRFVKE
jgi:hypothetical protein